MYETRKSKNKITGADPHHCITGNTRLCIRGNKFKTCTECK